MQKKPESPEAFLAAVAKAHEAIEDAKLLRQKAVQSALAAGVSAVRIAEALSVSRYRIYQIRDGK